MRGSRVLVTALAAMVATAGMARAQNIAPPAAAASTSMLFLGGSVANLTGDGTSSMGIGASGAFQTGHLMVQANGWQFSNEGVTSTAGLAMAGWALGPGTVSNRPSTSAPHVMYIGAGAYAPFGDGVKSDATLAFGFGGILAFSQFGFKFDYSFVNAEPKTFTIYQVGLGIKF
jgi:hypothetical protein